MKISIQSLNLTKVVRLLAVFALLAIPLLNVLPAKAAVNAGFSLSPASKTLTVGDDLVVYLMLDTGGNNVLAWKTTITYSATAFNSVSVATDSSSHFTLNPASDVASGGTIKIARYATSASSTNGAMAKITLHSSGTGNATLSFAHICSSTADSTPCSAVTDSLGTNLLSGITSGSYTVAAAPVAGSTTVKKKSLISKVSDAIASAVSPNTSAEDVTTRATKVSSSAIQITVLDKKGKPIAGAKVTLAGASALTDKNGQVVLTGLYPGEAEGSITYKDKTQKISLTIQSGTSLDSPQQAKFTFTAAGGSKVLPVIAALIGLAVIIGLIDLIFISKGGFKANIDNVLHHGGNGAASAGKTSPSARHSASLFHGRHETMTPGLIVEPNSKGTHHTWKD